MRYVQSVVFRQNYIMCHTLCTVCGVRTELHYVPYITCSPQAEIKNTLKSHCLLTALLFHDFCGLGNVCGSVVYVLNATQVLEQMLLCFA
jgi:hypothetical protein